MGWKDAPLVSSSSSSKAPAANAWESAPLVETPPKRQNVSAESEQGLLGKTLTNAVIKSGELASLGAGIYKGVGDIVLGGQKLVGKGLTALGADETGQFLTEDAIRRQNMQKEFIKPYKQFAPDVTGAGEFGGEVLATLPVGGVIAKPVQMLGKVAPQVSNITAPLAQSLRTGGFNTGMTRGAANIATKAAGGAVIGGTTAALINPEETDTGATIGAVAPLVLPTVGKYVVIGGGKIVDAFTGQLAPVKAGKVAREMAGDTINQIRATNNLAPIDINAAQAASGIDNDVYQAFLNFYAGKDKTSFQRILKDTQKADQLNRLAQLAGGATATEVITNIDSAKRVLNQLTTPMREEAFAKVAQTNKVVPELTQEAQTLRKEAAKKVEEVRRFVGQQVSKPTNVTPGLIDDVSVFPAAQTRAITPAQDNLATDYLLGKLAGSADEVAGKAAIDSITAGAAARSAEAKLAEISERGLKPISANNIASKIDALAMQPGTRMDDIQRKALLKISEKFRETGALSKDIVGPEDIYQVRKTSINDAMTQALSESGYDPSAQSQRLAGLLGDVRGYIDDAIRSAGAGKEWDSYLSTFAKGRQQLDQRFTAGQLLKILDQDKQKFVDIVKGQDPDFVEKIFGPGNKDIVQAMGGQRPNSPMVKLFGLADEIERDLKIKPQVKSGRLALGLEDQYGNPSDLIPGFVGYKTAIAKKILQVLTGKINDKAQLLLTEGTRSGKSMNEILNTFPFDERNKAIKLLTELAKTDKDLQRAIASGAVVLTTPPVNNLAPQQSNQNALAR
jgi:hypothetical protein